MQERDGNFHQEVLHIEKLMQQLQFQLDQQDQDPVVTSVSLSDILEPLIETFDLVHPDHDLTLDLPLDLSEVETEAFYLEELFRILLDNALKHTPKAENISVTGKMREGAVLLTFKNTGVGIDEDTQKALWNSQNRLEDRPKGHGFGLCIAREIAKKLHIKLLCTSEPNRFTQFTLSIPMNHS